MSLSKFFDFFGGIALSLKYSYAFLLYSSNYSIVISFGGYFFIKAGFLAITSAILFYIPAFSFPLSWSSFFLSY